MCYQINFTNFFLTSHNSEYRDTGKEAQKVIRSSCLKCYSKFSDTAIHQVQIAVFVEQFVVNCNLFTMHLPSEIKQTDGQVMENWIMNEVGLC
jgi:hypothetical protein